jgi:predicted amidohydrolase YtcJ
VRTRTAAVAPGAWIQGETLIATDLAEQRFPDRWELDTVAPSNPVVLRSMGEHVI